MFLFVLLVFFFIKNVFFGLLVGSRLGIHLIILTL